MDVYVRKISTCFPTYSVIRFGCSLLEQLYADRGCRLHMTTGARALQVPVQRDECDCGVYMLLNVKHTLGAMITYMYELSINTLSLKVHTVMACARQLCTEGAHLRVPI